MCANSECYGETAPMRMLTRAFAGRLCDKHHNLMSGLIYFSADKVNSMTKEEMLSKVSDTLGSETEEYNKVLSR